MAAKLSPIVYNLVLRMDIKQAITLHQTGRIVEAKAAYLAVLKKAPRNFDAWHFLGLVHAQLGQPLDAVKCFEKVLALAPTHAEAHFNLGTLLVGLNRHADAIRCYERAVGLRPEDVDARNNLGCTLAMLNRHQEAIPHFERVVADKPQDVQACQNLGNALTAAGRHQDAIGCFERIIALQPANTIAHVSMGIALADMGRNQEARYHFERAIAIRPDLAEAHYNLGTLLSRLEQRAEAIRYFERAIAIKPDYAEAHNNLGNALAKLDRHAEAVQHLKRAIAINPDDAEAYFSLGNPLKEQGKLDEAVANYRKALSCKPDYVAAYSNLLFLYGYHALLDPQEYLSLARGWESSCLPAHDQQVARSRSIHRLPLAGRRLRVGYVSGDYRAHAMSYFIEQLFSNHDRAHLELFAYSTDGRRDAVTDRLQALAEHWLPLTGLSDLTICERIESDGIDVLIDLSGHTEHGRLGIFARRAAPVQIHYLGFFASTGLTEMDYWIGDDILTPPETDGHFSERVWRLPRTWVSYEGKANAPLPDWQPAPDGAIWLGSFNNLSKLTPKTLALWAKILHALPEGRLLLKTRQLTDAGNRQRILDAAAGLGIPSSRIELQDSGNTPDWPAHMAYYNRLDIALDPVSAVGGGTTTCDALWMAVPVVTLIGDRMASRMTASMLNAIGHPDWIAKSEAEYIAKVIALARGVDQRKELRRNLRSQMAQSPLCDAQDLAMNLENAYFDMFKRWFDAKNAQICTAT